MNAWIEALRLRTLPLSAAGVVVAAGLAAWMDVFRIAVFVPMLIMVILLQTLANFADEYGDLHHGVDNENRIGPRRGLQRGDITDGQMRIALMVTCMLTALSMVWLLGVSFSGSGNVRGFVVFALLGVLCAVAAVKYTVGRGAYGYLGLGDLVTLLTFGVLAVVGGFYLYAHDLVAVVWLPAVGLGCLATGVLNLNNMRDIENDRDCGKITVAVLLGPKRAPVYHALLVCVGVAGFVAFPFAVGITAPARYIFALFAVLLLSQLMRVLRVSDPVEYDTFMKPLSMTTALMALAFTVCLAV